MKKPKSLIKRSILGRLFKTKIKEVKGVNEVSERSIEFLIKYLEKEIETIAEESCKGNYYRVMPLDIQRGIDKFENAIEEKKTGRSYMILRQLLNLRQDDLDESPDNQHQRV